MPRSPCPGLGSSQAPDAVSAVKADAGSVLLPAANFKVQKEGLSKHLFNGRKRG